MTALDLRPAAAPAPRPRRVIRHAMLEARLVVRNGEQLLLALVIPLALIVGQRFLGPRLGIDTQTTVASVIALGLWSTGFTSLAITTAFERRYGVLERLAATPLRPLDLLLGKAAAMTALAAGQAAVLVVAGLAAGWAPHPDGWQSLVVVATVPLALVAFASFALALIVGQRFLGPRLGIDTDTTVASVIALGLWSTGFTSLAITTAFERRYGVLERLAATPLRPLDLLLGKAAAMTALATGQAAVLVVAGLAAGWAPHPDGWQSLVVVATVPLALVAFASFALALSGRGSAELTLGLANLIYLLGAAAGLLVPPSLFPEWAQPVLACLPTTALAEALRAWATGVVQPWPVVVTLVWSIAGLLLARKAFRWTS